MQFMHQPAAKRASVYAALRSDASDGFLAHARRRLFGDAASPFLVELGDEMAAQARRLARRAPPRMLYPVIASIRLPRPVALVELPAGEALYVEVEDGQVCVCFLQTDGRSLGFEPVAGSLFLPAEDPQVDWEAIDAEAWTADEAADAGWQAWADASIEAAPAVGSPRATGREHERLLRKFVLPALVSLALITSPLAEVEPTFWVSMREADEG